MIAGYLIDDGKVIETTDKNDMAWIDVVQPTDTELQYILNEYSLPKDYLYDVGDVYEVPRVEGLDDDKPDLFVISYPVKKAELAYATRVVSVIVVSDVVITIRQQDSLIFENIKSAGFSKMSHKEEIENFVIELAWRISKEFIASITLLNKQIECIDNTIRKSSKSDSLYEMIDIQKSLINFKIAIKENKPVLKSIFDLENLLHSNTKDELLHDLLVENKQAEIMIEKSTMLIDKLSDLFTNLVNYNLNTIMKVLTSITIVMTIPTIIGGLWGMNVDLPFADQKYAFVYLMLFVIIISVVIIRILRRYDLL